MKFRALLLIITLSLLAPLPGLAADLELAPPAGVDYTGLLNWGQATPVAADQSFMKMSGTDFRKAKEIVILTFNTNIGDNLVADFGNIAYLHAQNPDAIIKVISPTSRIFTESAWLKPIQLKINLPTGYIYDRPESEPAILPEVSKLRAAIQADSTMYSKALQTALEPHLKPDSFVFFDNHTTTYLRDQVLDLLGTEAQKPSVESNLNHDFESLSRWLGEKIQKTEAGAVVLHKKNIQFFPGGNRPPVITRWSTLSKRFVPETISTVYETSAIQGRMIFGSDFKLSWPKSLFHNEKAFEAPFQDLLKKSFKKPDAPFVVINMNSKHSMKVAMSGEPYADVYESFVSYMKKNHPDVNIFIAPVEEAFGHKNIKRVNQLVAAHSSRVAYLPAENKPLWNSIIAGAKAVISHDSGFVHLANVFNPNVLSLSFTPLLGAQNWRLPGQKVIDIADWRVDQYGKNQPSKEHRKVLGWVDPLLPTRPPNCLGGYLKDLRGALSSTLKSIF